MSERRVYDHVVGLGFDCRLAYNLRRTFGFTRAYPFDWWVTPLPALVAILRDPSTERLYDPACLQPSLARGGIGTIRNAQYDIELTHEFPRGRDGLVAPDWRASIGRARERTDHLMTRLLGFEPGARVLFVRATKRSEGRKLGAEFAPLIGAVRQGLSELFPRLETDLLLIDPPHLIEADGVMNLSIDDPTKADWRGTPELWTEKLLGAGLAMRGADSQAFVSGNPEADHEYLAGP